ATTDEDRQGAGFTDGTGHKAQESIHPAQALVAQRLHATGRDNTQTGGTGKAVHSSPDCITGNVRRISKEQERTPNQRRVEEVLAGTAKDFLADHHAEADTQSNLPERNAGWNNQGEQDGADKETFVNL